MFSLDLEPLRRAAADIERGEKNLRFATAVALTKSMQDARTEEIGTMKRVFDRPTPYALNALQVRPATKTNLRAELGFKEFGGTPAWKFLGPQVRGGSRNSKRFENALRAVGALKGGEFVVPGPGIRLNAYGNIPGGQITRILSALGASSDPMQNRNRAKKTKRPRADYFVVRDSKAPGVYMRSGRRVTPVLLFVGAPTYRPRFPYYEVARRVVPVAFQRQMRGAWDRYVVPEMRKAP